jgi:hypothetical protein
MSPFPFVGVVALVAGHHRAGAGDRTAAAGGGRPGPPGQGASAAPGPPRLKQVVKEPRGPLVRPAPQTGCLCELRPLFLPRQPSPLEVPTFQPPGGRVWAQCRRSEEHRQPGSQPQSGSEVGAGADRWAAGSTMLRRRYVFLSNRPARTLLICPLFLSCASIHLIGCCFFSRITSRSLIRSS